MAEIVGAYFTSHVPAIGGAIHRGDQQDPYWKPFFDGFPKVHEWLAAVKPDVAVVFSNDHGLNFFLDRMPTFAVGRGWGRFTVRTDEVMISSSDECRTWPCEKPRPTPLGKFPPRRGRFGRGKRVTPRPRFGG